MPEENRVFDVSRPGRSDPGATSKPVIVGHHPSMNDPMVKGEATKIQVLEDKPEPDPIPPMDPNLETVMPPTDEAATDAPAGIITPPEAIVAPIPEPATDEPHHSPQHHGDYQGPSHVEPLQVGPARRRRRWPVWVIIILVILIAAYLVIDSGLVKTNINLPVHFFKQKSATPAVQTPPPVSKPSAATAPSVPAGFTKYKLADTPIIFNAPSSWGAPTSTPEPGYSTRGGTNKSDGTYAYIVDFAANKDVQIVVTSSKYLPATPSSRYYDYLQWCVGTNDDKIYKTILHFTTANKVDTPTTTTCDQGPLADAVKLDSTTIVQAKTKDANGQVIGDLYTKNLDDKDLPVLRVKDAAMTNADDIKTLLSSAQFASS